MSYYHVGCSFSPKAWGVHGDLMLPHMGDEQVGGGGKVSPGLMPMASP